MRRFENNLGKALGAQQDSPLGYGSKFRKAELLKQLLNCHPNWERFKNLLNNGSIWPLAEISEEERIKDMEEALTFGNHKGAMTKPDLLKLLVNDDVIHGFALPLPLKKIRPWARGLCVMRLKTIGRGRGGHPLWAHPYSS